MKSEEGQRRPNRGRGRGGGRGRGKQPRGRLPDDAKKILVLHGSRQTGPLLLGRMDKLCKALQKTDDLCLQMVAPDGPFDHPEDTNLRQWWDRHDNTYQGLEISMGMLLDLWNIEPPGSFVGIMGFSQGARLAHLMALMHQCAKQQQSQCGSKDDNKIPFEGLQFVIMVAGYHRPLPDNWPDTLQACQLDAALSTNCRSIAIPSLHVWGETDPLIPPSESQAVMESYQNPQIHAHEKGHHVPMKAPNVQAFLDFIRRSISSDSSELNSINRNNNKEAIIQSSPEPQSPPTHQPKHVDPDGETAQAQQDEVEALTAIYPEEITILSKTTMNDDTGETAYKHPIRYQMALRPEEPGTGGHWPKHPLSLGVTYPHNYPSDEAIPELQLVHENNVMEFSSAKAMACMRAIQEAANAERGMPCVLSCFYAAREFLDAGEEIADGAAVDDVVSAQEGQAEKEDNNNMDQAESTSVGSTLLKQASAERIHQCNMEGLEIAEALLGRAPQSSTTGQDESSGTPLLSGKGGNWNYTIGLVGKPSAGKSTFFNTASAFARQRDDADNVLGGASMAPHPFTTIDPNIGFCFVPAPKGTCPEEDADEAILSKFQVGCSHGRDSKGRRLLPVLLKDVAGLVPGAYQGRGRGNKFLNDLTDAVVLVHVVDASGMADAEGNALGEEEIIEASQNGDAKATSRPLEDLSWIRNELIEWVFTNLMHKWDTVIRRGRSKLSGMFSGYGQTSAVVTDVLNAVEKHMERTQDMDRALDRLNEWDTGDVHRVVSAFLGVRFPMALALNKYDLESSGKHVKAIQSALPLHGAHVGVPLSARSEMTFVRDHIVNHQQQQPQSKTEGNPPLGTWQCLQAAMSLREPVLVFPVSDMSTYEPLAGLTKHAVGDPSLPSAGMIACLQAAGGSIPTLWDAEQGIYASNNKGGKQQQQVLRDVVVMKPGSTVEDVFLCLKRLGALGGDFVRAEGAGDLGETSKQIKKDAMVNKRCRILKIMTTKRTAWQQQHAAS
ncbi:Uncharacterized GTP-binding protein C428.15 [Seminavis robusta]|uniref:Uncharacterized GTP-binding protein C428.15 n=1 Tax=Seminavis robusta TaxID=568900 RepID=A0A9N8HDP5_9STRA|nr:Uncharacterized GTP-binding protein C428.15 [Seminavis robusta]|eukprot:Sro471_g149710.1 Uncharacterized GTP-binding protein C428.15 (1006) ;mRNA; f:27992-31375